jgi:hypothetical protein
MVFREKRAKGSDRDENAAADSPPDQFFFSQQPVNGADSNTKEDGSLFLAIELRFRLPVQVELECFRHGFIFTTRFALSFWTRPTF